MTSRRSFRATQNPPLSGAHICDACQGDCRESCFNDAIVADAGNGVRILAENCAGCGACVAVCDLGHIRLEHGVARIVLIDPRFVE